MKEGEVTSTKRRLATGAFKGAISGGIFGGVTGAAIGGKEGIFMGTGWFIGTITSELFPIKKQRLLLI